jgi:hypothetical protein
MEYTIVESYTLEHLITLVNEHLAIGWKCQGGVIFVGKYIVDRCHSIYSGNIFLQAMIKEKDVK